MSRTALSCDACRYRLGHRRPNGKVRIEPDVLVVRFASGVVALTCPACGALTWGGEAVVWIVPPKPVTC